MLINSLKQLVINHCPNIPFLAKALARARIYSFERYLLPEEDIRRAEQQVEVKKEILQKRMEKFHNYAKKLDKDIERILNVVPAYKDRQDLAEIRIDMLFCGFAYGFSPEEYVFFFLEKKNADERLA